MGVSRSTLNPSINVENSLTADCESLNGSSISDHLILVGHAGAQTRSDQRMLGARAGTDPRPTDQGTTQKDLDVVVRDLSFRVEGFQSRPPQSDPLSCR